MLEVKGQVVVFNIYSHDGIFNDVKLTKDDILFITFISSKSVLKRSCIHMVKNVNPIFGIEFPKLKISLGHGNREIVLWRNTRNERKFIFTGEGNNLLFAETLEGREYSSISINDYEKYKDYEVEALRIYPEFNERLFLCSQLKTNIDPMKELAFNRKIDLICSTYVDVISGVVRLSDLGY